MTRAPAVTIAFDQDRPVVDAASIAPLLELGLSEFQALMRAGRIRSTIERGEGDDTGRFRITFQSPTWRVRLTCVEDGTVISTARVKLPAAADGAASGPAAGSST